jgi:tetratricopeptide (TPR) repeat protein
MPRIERQVNRIGFFGPLLLAMVLGACSATKDFSAEHAFDMPSPTEKGYAALAAGDNPTAVKWLTIAARDKPDDPYLTLDLAAAYQRLGRFDDARKLYQGVVDTAAGIVPEKAANAELKGRDLSQIAAADLAICSACAMPEPAIKAYQAFAAGDFASAAGQLEAAAAVSIGLDNLYLQLDQAATDRRLGRAEAARKHYQVVAEKAKDLPDTKPPPVVPPPPAQHAKTLAEIAEADLAALGK